jgi:hypothetical protein
VHPAVVALSERLQETYGESVDAVLYYGSCQRGGDPFDGLVDLYLIVNGYRNAYGRLLPSFFNWLLPPNVYYLETDVDGRTVRAKYAVVSMRDFRRGTSSRWFHSYLWARFAQPVGIVYLRDPVTANSVFLALSRAVVTFVDRVLPLAPPAFDVSDLWRTGMLRTYRAELRVEKKHRTAGIVESDRQYYQAVTEAALPDLSFILTQTGNGYRCYIGAGARYWSRLQWISRTGQGKLLSVLRLAKAAFTFAGGIDYIVWKLERHSGESIEVPDYVRRAPLIFVWGLFWRLYRKGVFR